MKSLIVFARIIIVGLLWGIVFTEGMRVIMLCNWHFDIFWPDHWRQVHELWQAGWRVRAPKEWAFVILLFTFIPMLLTGWWTLCLVEWERVIYNILISPLTLYRKFIKTPINVITTNNKYGVVKKKSYKQIRPVGLSGGIRSPISDYGDSRSEYTSPTASGSYPPAVSALSTTSASRPSQPAKKAADVAATIDHALFKFDDDDDDFDLDIDSFEKTDFKKKPAKDSHPTEKNQNRRKKFDFDEDDEEDNIPKRAPKRDRDERPQRDNRGKEQNKDKPRSEKTESAKNNQRTEKESSPQGPVYEILQQKNYGIIRNVTVKDVVLDYVAVSDENIILCSVDKETGDWLADEELFNGEEPLWFSESSHRVSPIRKLGRARDALQQLLEDEDFEQNIQAYAIVQMANIINADDMFEIWKDMNIEVTRVNRGAPKDIPLFSKTLPAAENSMSRKEFDRLQKLLKSNR